MSYSVNDGETWKDITLASTSINGDYSEQWTPVTSGSYLLRAKWNGDELLQLKGSEAYTALAVAQSEKKYVFSVISDSTVSELTFNSTNRELTFTVDGPSGTSGYTNITMAKSLVADINSLRIYLDKAEIDYNAISMPDSWLLHFTYQHSAHKVVVALGSSPTYWDVQGFLRAATILGVIIVTATVTLIYLEKRKKTNNK